MTALQTATGIAEQWIYQQLSSDAQLAALGVAGVYSTVAPQGAVFPCIVFAGLSAVDTTYMHAYRGLTTLKYAIKVIGQGGSIANLDAISWRVDHLLQGAAGSTGGQGYVYSSQRTTQAVIGDPDLGIEYRQLVNVYQITVTEGQ